MFRYFLMDFKCVALFRIFVTKISNICSVSGPGIHIFCVVGARNSNMFRYFGQDFVYVVGILARNAHNCSLFGMGIRICFDTLVRNSHMCHYFS